MGDCGSKNTVDDRVQKTENEVETKNQHIETFRERLIEKLREKNMEGFHENLMVEPVRDSTTDEYKPLLKLVIGTSKLHPSAGFNFSKNATFEASKLDNIAANTITTNMTDSKSKINNN